MHDKLFIDKFNQSCINEFADNHLIKLYGIEDVIKYAIERGGKRLRPMLMHTILNAYNIQDETIKSIVYQLSIFIEGIHMYSLIIDDLPCMDDDDFRNNLLAVHVKFNIAKAILSAEYILSRCISGISRYGDEYYHEFNSRFAELITGQYIDVNNIDINSSDLSILKTSSLFRLSCNMTSISCGLNKKERGYLDEFGKTLGVYFQLIDDIIDINICEKRNSLILSLRKHREIIDNIISNLSCNQSIIIDMINYIDNYFQLHNSKN